MHSRDNPAADEVRWLSRVSDREEESGCKDITVVFAAEFNSPAISLGVPNLDFGIGSVEVLFDELEGSLRRPDFSSRPPDPIRGAHGSGLLPEKRLAVRRRTRQRHPK